MKFGSREVCDVVFRAKATQKIGSKIFYAGQPVLLIDTAKTTTLEGDSEATYATGGRGNSRLLEWDGSKTITFTVEDALFSAIGLSILMGADIAETSSVQEVHVHKMAKAETDSTSAAPKINLGAFVKGVHDTSETPATDTFSQKVCGIAPLYVMEIEEDGSLTGNYLKATNVADPVWNDTTKSYDQFITLSTTADSTTGQIAAKTNTTYMVDFYVIRNATTVQEIQVRKDKFAGYFYVEAETLYRRQDSGNDMPATITIPKVKIQSNFSISMSSDGDPSTATFTMDAFPDYTYFDKTKEVLCVIQIIDDDDSVLDAIKPVMLHDDDNTTSATTNHPFLRTDGSDNYGFSDTYKKDETGTKYDDGGTVVS